MFGVYIVSTNVWFGEILTGQDTSESSEMWLWLPLMFLLKHRASVRSRHWHRKFRAFHAFRARLCENNLIGRPMKWQGSKKNEWLQLGFSTYHDLVYTQSSGAHPYCSPVYVLKIQGLRTRIL